MKIFQFSIQCVSFSLGEGFIGHVPKSVPLHTLYGNNKKGAIQSGSHLPTNTCMARNIGNP